MITFVIEIGRPFPLFGYHGDPMPGGPVMRQLNLGLVSIMWFGGSLVDLIDRWRRLVRREAWQAVTGGATEQ